MQFLNRNQVAERTGISVSSIKRFEALGRFPRRVPLSENRVGWLLSEIDDWIAARVAERDEARPSGGERSAR